MNNKDYFSAADQYAKEHNNFSEFREKYHYFLDIGLDKHSAIENALFQIYGNKCKLVTSL